MLRPTTFATMTLVLLAGTSLVLSGQDIPFTETEKLGVIIAWLGIIITYAIEWAIKEEIR